MAFSLRLHYGGARSANRWINDDIKPLPPSRRTWSQWTFFTWWSVWQTGIANWQIGGSLVALGLSVWQAMISIIIGRIILAWLAVLNGHPGATWHIGFPVFSRMIWGVYGQYMIVVIRLFLVMFGFAFQSFIGGLCITAILGAIFPTFASMPNTIPAGSNVTTQQLIGWLLFNVCTVPLLFKRPEKSPRVILILVSVSSCTLIGILIWALVTAHGAGPLLSAPSKLKTSDEIGWTMISGISTTVGSVILASMAQSDFTRFAQKPKDQIMGQWLAFLVLGTIVPLLGALIAAASSQIYGQPIWNPPTLLLTWLETNYGPQARAGAFFAGVGLTSCQLGIQAVDNGFSSGMDLAGLFPKYINIRRGALLSLLISMAMCPWQILASAGTFVAVLNSWGIFIAPVCGIQVAEYWIIRQKRIKLSDLYTADSDRLYYYTRGFNWRAIVAWLIGVVPLLPGFITTINPAIKTSTGAINLYSMAVIYGFIASFVAQLALDVVFKPRMGAVDSGDQFGTFTPKEMADLGLISGDHDSDGASDTVVTYEKPKGEEV